MALATAAQRTTRLPVKKRTSSVVGRSPGSAMASMSSEGPTATGRSSRSAHNPAATASRRFTGRILCERSTPGHSWCRASARTNAPSPAR